jgi:hypothetical protein
MVGGCVVFMLSCDDDIAFSQLLENLEEMGEPIVYAQLIPEVRTFRWK